MIATSGEPDTTPAGASDASAGSGATDCHDGPWSATTVEVSWSGPGLRAARAGGPDVGGCRRRGCW